LVVGPGGISGGASAPRGDPLLLMLNCLNGYFVPPFGDPAMRIQ